MNGVMVFALLGSSLLSYSVKHALDDTAFRLDSGALPVTIKTADNTGSSAVDRHARLPSVIWDEPSDYTSAVNETVDAKRLDGGYDHLEPELLKCGTQRRCSGKCRTVDDEGSNESCRCDTLCWFFGDCCLGYYDDCLQMGMNETDHAIMVATLSKLGSYGHARALRRALKLIKLSTCRVVPNHSQSAHLVGECSADPYTESKFHALYQKLTRTLPGQDINFFAGISKEEFIAKCQGQSKKRHEEHILETIPVTLVDSYRIDFLNVFCAICNGVEPVDVSYWESRIVCYGEKNGIEYAIGAVLNVSGALHEHCSAETVVPTMARKCVDSNAYYAPGNSRRHHYPINSSSVYNHTEAENSSPQIISFFNLTGDDIMQPQENILSDHPSNGKRIGHSDDGNDSTDARIQAIQMLNQFEQLTCSSQSHERARLCRMYTYSFYIGFTVYKNPHCLPCPSSYDYQNKSLNFWDSFACPRLFCSCNPGYSPLIINDPNQNRKTFPGNIVLDTFIASLRVVFDFRRHTMMVMVDDRYPFAVTDTCPQNQTYVPHYQGCRDIVCPQGGHLVGLACVAGDGYGGQGEDGITLERLALVNTTKRVTVRMRFHYILDVQRYSDPGGALIRDDRLDEVSASKDLSQKTYQGQGGSPEQSGHHTGNKRSTDRFSILDRNMMRALWNEATRQHGDYDMGEAVNRLSAGVNETMISHISGSGGVVAEIHSLTDFVMDQGNSVFISISSDFDQAASLDELLPRLAHWRLSDSLTRIANDNNFILGQVEISSHSSDTPVSVGKSDDRKIMRPCSNREKLVYKKFKVSVGENDSHAIRFRDGWVALSETTFTLIVDLHDADEDIALSHADIGVCQPYVAGANCSYVYFNRSDFVVYGDSLVVSTRARDLTYFLGALTSSERTLSSLADLVGQFEQKYGQSDIVIHRPEYYILTEDGAYVCQNYSQDYNITSVGNLTVMYSVLLVSFAEQVATAVSLALSILCLVVVLVVYGLVKELRNIPGKIVMSMSGALLLAQVIFLFSTYPRGLACEIYAAVQHAMWLVSFAWLAVMAIHLAYVLYFQTHTTSTSAFRIFSGLCWGLPFLYVGCLFALDKTSLLNIQYGMGGICWFGNPRAMIYAFGMPLFTMLFATLVSAVFVVRAIRRSSKFRHNNTLNHSGEKTQLLLCVNLSLLMGFNWVFYFLAVATDTTAMWTVFIVTNGSQGCYIFLCYVARRAILSKVIKQLSICQGQGKQSRYAQGSPTASHRVTKSTTLSPATSMKNLYLVVNPRSSPSSSPTPSPTRFDYIIAL